MTADFRILLCTWNVGGNPPPADFDGLLGLKARELPDLYGIGLQELNGATQSAVLGMFMEDDWTKQLSRRLSREGYVRLTVIRMQGLSLLAFVKKKHLPHINNVETQYTRAGLSGLWGNKGGVSVRLDIYGVDICIVNCHLAAHLDNTDERIRDYQSIVDCQTFNDTNNILDHDYVFWLGDLNFRLDDISREGILEKIENNDLETLWKYDQLRKSMQEERILVDFEEGPLRFPPTYKFDPGTDFYDRSSKNRKPAWCDRILWMVHEDSFEDVKLTVALHHYKSRSEYKMSDHKPVTAAFTTKVIASNFAGVTFDPIRIWYTDENETCSYKVKKGIKTSKWDYIGLYERNFKHLKDYVTYEWADPEGDEKGETGCTVKFKGIKAKPGEYLLCYVDGSSKFVRGMTDLQIFDEESSSLGSSSASSSSFEGLKQDDSDVELATEASEEMEEM